MEKVHARLNAVGGRFPALCNQKLHGADLAVYFAVDISRRCVACQRGLIRRGYSIKGLEKRFEAERIEANKYSQLSRGD